MKENTTRRRLASWIGCAAVVILVGVWVAQRHPAAHCPKGSDLVGDTLRLRYAEHLELIRLPHCWQVNIRNPWHPDRLLHRYVLVPREDSARCEALPEGTPIPVPVERSVVFTASHCQLLAWLGAEAAVTGVCDRQYIHVPSILRRAIDCGDAMLPTTERIMDLRPQALLVSPFENSGGYGSLDQTGIPIVEAAEYMEPTPLGRAEWMRFYGLLYGRERQADSLFRVVDSTYQALCRRADRLPLGRKVLTERITGSTWYVPGGRSSMATLLRYANAAYAFADDGHGGSLPLSLEQVIDEAGDSDLWLMTHDGRLPMTRARLLAECHAYNQLRAFRQGDIYACDTERSHYFDEIPFRPDLLLRDLTILTHPAAHPTDTLRYYEKVPFAPTCTLEKLK